MTAINTCIRMENAILLNRCNKRCCWIVYVDILHCSKCLICMHIEFQLIFCQWMYYIIGLLPNKCSGAIGPNCIYSIFVYLSGDENIISEERKRHAFINVINNIMPYSIFQSEFSITTLSLLFWWYLMDVLSEMRYDLDQKRYLNW